MNEPTLSHDEATRVAVIAFPGGHKLTIKNVDKTQADKFFKQHAAEFARRDCVLHTTACMEVRNG